MAYDVIEIPTPGQGDGGEVEAAEVFVNRAVGLTELTCAAADSPCGASISFLNLPERMNELSDGVIRPLNATREGRRRSISRSPVISSRVRITTADVPSDARPHLKRGEVAIESIAHACFRIHSARGSRILIDPYASRVWLGYDFPEELATDSILITHPHFDHDGGELIGRKVPWTPEVRVLRDPGNYTVGDFHITGMRGKHADPWGKEFGQKNTIWRVEVSGLRIAHLGDNGPLTESNVRELGRVDILMMPIDAREHILKRYEVQAIRHAARPRVLIPMHYRHPDLESSEESPQGLGPIDPWLAGKKRVTRLKSSYARFTTSSLKSGERIIVFQHSPRVRTGHGRTKEGDRWTFR